MRLALDFIVNLKYIPAIILWVAAMPAFFVFAGFVCLALAYEERINAD